MHVQPLYKVFENKDLRILTDLFNNATVLDKTAQDCDSCCCILLYFCEACNGDNDAVSIAVETRELLDCDRYVDLWVSWDEGHLRFGRGVLPGYHILLDHTMNQTHRVQAISLSSGYGNDANFTLDADTGM